MMFESKTPDELFVVEDENGVPQRNFTTGTMFYTRMPHAVRKLRDGWSVISYTLTRGEQVVRRDA
ncbi:hypothetical protein ACODYM_29410 [Burkholderia gladioli]|uniref:hypothetical protein n=1 Tax=Burkholderia gladioli TaxID=28095 RepID=UPI003B502727